MLSSALIHLEPLPTSHTFDYVCLLVFIDEKDSQNEMDRWDSKTLKIAYKSK